MRYLFGTGSFPLEQVDANPNHYTFCLNRGTKKKYELIMKNYELI